LERNRNNWKKEKGPESISVLGILIETKEIKEKRGDQRSDMSYSRYRVKSSTRRKEMLKLGKIRPITVFLRCTRE
jgi:hypothetical protein